MPRPWALSPNSESKPRKGPDARGGFAALRHETWYPRSRHDLLLCCRPLRHGSTWPGPRSGCHGFVVLAAAEYDGELELLIKTAQGETGCLRPMGRLCYSGSMFLCLPNALSQPGGHALARRHERPQSARWRPRRGPRDSAGSRTRRSTWSTRSGCRTSRDPPYRTHRGRSASSRHRRSRATQRPRQSPVSSPRLVNRG